MIAVGVANPIAHGQATTKTAILFTSARVKADRPELATGAGTRNIQIKNVTRATPITTGTK
ncbi:hypothetical protein SDC9_172241 [bioreactor metagenome]|uniref:Uncharacterized protein n=1 Tax=bioreactor metagenome TaxID=1076179 RepID=A0A645GFA4_9ZZZZ